MTVEQFLTNYLFSKCAGDFHPKDVFKQLARLEDLENNYSNESKLLGSQSMAKLEANAVYQQVVAQGYSVFMQQRLKFQMLKAINYRILGRSEAETTPYQKGLSWTVGNPEKGIGYKVFFHTSDNGTSSAPASYLRCSCEFGALSGVPCSHEFWVQDHIQRNYHAQQGSLLKIRSRWGQEYEEENRKKLYREKDGLMYIHRLLNFAYVEKSRVLLGAPPRERRPRKKTPLKEPDLALEAEKRLE